MRQRIWISARLKSQPQHLLCNGNQCNNGDDDSSNTNNFEMNCGEYKVANEDQGSDRAGERDEAPKYQTDEIITGVMHAQHHTGHTDTGDQRVLIEIAELFSFSAPDVD